MSATTAQPRNSRWIPWTFVGGMLLVLFVNIGMVVAALSTFTGVTTGRAYDRGRAYNHILEEAARQDALGWQASLAVAAPGLRLSAQDRAAQPLAATPQGVLRRPMDGAEAPLTFQPAGPGAWTAALPTLPPGLWEARLTLSDAAGQHFDIRQRVVLP